MTLLLWTLAVPLLTAVLGVVPLRRPLKEANLVSGLALTLALALATARQFLAGSTPTAFEEALRVDGLSALVLVLSAFVGLLSGAYSVGYLRRNEARGLVSPWRRREFDALVPLYVFAMLLMGLFLMVTRRKAVTQILALLTVENSVFLVALGATTGMPLIVELGISFDVIVAVLVLGVLVRRIVDRFESMDVSRLSKLKG